MASALNEHESPQTPTRTPKPESLERACQCAKIADEFRGMDIKVLDLSQVTPEFDYFVIATGNSRRQLHAIVEEVDRMMATSGSKRIGLEGYDSNNWILQDYGDIVLHVFDPAGREQYSLERLWADAEEIDWVQALKNDGESHSAAEENHSP